MKFIVFIYKPKATVIIFHSKKHRKLGICVAMAFRGGRGRTRVGGLHPRKREEPFIRFPEMKEYPIINLKDIDKEFMILLSWSFDLHNFWIPSSYHLEDGAKKNGGLKRRPLSDFIKMTDEYVPAELVAKKVNVRIRRSAGIQSWT